MRFYLPQNESDLQLGWYGDKVGRPAPLQIQVLGDQNGRLSKVVYGNTTIDGAEVGSTAGWQMPAALTGNFSAGYHWVLFSSPGSDNSSYYEVYMSNYQVGNNTALAWEAYVGPWFQHGSSVLWIKDSLGDNVTVYPCVQVDTSPLTTQTFTASRSYTFNTIFLFLSERGYNPTNGTLTVSDETANDATLATGVLSQSLIQGLMGWVPIILDNSVITIPGHTYLLTVSEPHFGYSWRVVMRGLYTDPSTAGFQNQSRYWLFRLGNIEWGQSHYDFSELTPNVRDAVSSGYMDAVRVIPSTNETFTSVQILMMSNTQPGNYTTGTFSVGIWDGNGSQPIGPPLEQVSIPATDVQANGFLNISRFNQGVVAGRDYWIVFSANSTEHFTIGRLVGGYAYLVKVSSNNGLNWYGPRAGPTEFAFVASFSNQSLGNYIEGFPSVELSPNSDLAQSFVASNDTQVDGVFLGPLGQGPDVRVSIYPDTGHGRPSLDPIASGVFDTNNVTYDVGLQFVQFSSVANLQKGQMYWLEITPIGGYCRLSLIEYLPSAPAVPKNSSALLSSNNGLTWARVSNDTSLILYSLASPVTPLPSLSTSAITSDLASYHSFSIQNGILRGWNAFLEASRLDLYSQVTLWLNNATGRQFQFFASAEANEVVQLKPVDFTALSESEQNTDCASATDSLISQMPFSGQQFFSEDGLSSSSCEAVLRPLAAQLSQMLYVGGNYGVSTGEDVLVVGDPQASNLSRTLSVAYNCTYTQLSLDAGLGDESNLTQYKVILWTSEVDPFGSGNLTRRLEAYVARGGELIVILTDGKSSTVADLLYSLPVEGSPGQLNTGAAFLNASTLHTGYAGLLSISNISSSSTLAISGSLTLGVHNYGQGRFAFVDLSSPAFPQVSDLSTLLSNLISQSSGNGSPVWYGLTSPGTQSPLLFAILGSNGEPVLLWFVNPTNSPANTTLNLDSSYYGLSSSHKVIDLDKMSVSASSGSVVQIHIMLAPDSWDPVFIVNSRATWLTDYTNALLKGEFVYPNQSLHDFLGEVGQTTVVGFSSDSNIGEVVLNDRSQLPVLSNMGAIASASQGWYFDAGTNTLFVKYTATGIDELRIILMSKTKTPTPTVPVSLLFKILILFVAAEVSLFTFGVAVKPAMKRRTTGNGRWARAGRGLSSQLSLQGMSGRASPSFLEKVTKAKERSKFRDGDEWVHKVGLCHLYGQVTQAVLRIVRPEDFEHGATNLLCRFGR
jgi:hypothetical protein